jgi:hypothetical protein
MNSDANDGNPDDTPGNNTSDGDPDEGDAVGAVFEDCPSFADDDVETMQITVHNETGGQGGLNLYAWQLHERNPGSSVSRSAV